MAQKELVELRAAANDEAEEEEEGRDSTAADAQSLEERLKVRQRVVLVLAWIGCMRDRREKSV